MPPPHRGPHPLHQALPQAFEGAEGGGRAAPSGSGCGGLGGQCGHPRDRPLPGFGGAGGRQGVEAALAKGRSADHKSALAKAEKVQDNTQCALDQTLNLASKRGEEVEAMRGTLREAEYGRRKAEVEAAQLGVESEAQQRRGDDLQQCLGVAEAQVRTLSCTLTASSTAQQGRKGCRVRVAGVGVGVNDSWDC